MTKDVSHEEKSENKFSSKLMARFVAKHYVTKTAAELTPGEVILGTIISEGESQQKDWRPIDLVKEEDFPLPHEKRLFKALKQISEEDGDEAISILTVSLRLQNDQDSYWTPSAIVRISAPEHGLLPSTHNLFPYIQAIRNISMCAKIIESIDFLLMSLDRDCRNDPLPLLNAHSLIVSEMLLQSPKTKDALIWSEQFWTDYVDELEERIQNPLGHGDRLTLGLEAFDNVLPMSKSNLVILAGRPGVGKTSSLLFFIESIVKSNPKAIGLIISLEMSMKEIGDKRVASAGSVEVMKFKKPETFNDDDMDRVVAAIKDMQERENNRVAYIDKSTFKVSDIRREIKRIKKEKGAIDWAAIDYLGLIKHEGKQQDLYHKITAISGELKRLAREENILIICLAQLNRDTAKTKGKPEMKDLRDSGAIEQDADAIIFVHRENYHAGEKVLQEEGKFKNFAQNLSQPLDQNTYLCIRKNRHGVEQRIDIPFAYIPEYGKMAPVFLSEK
jgi:replicative DNA helicase